MLRIAALLTGSQIRFGSVRGREGRKSLQVHWSQTPVEQLGTKHRARAPALLPRTPTHDLEETGDGADHNSRYQRLLTLRSPPSHAAKHVIGPRIPRSWIEHLDDENWNLIDTAEIESWVMQDLFRTCASVEPVSELDFCRMVMTAIVIGHVNAVCTLECVHRRQLLAARALNELSLLLRGHPFPRTKTIGHVYSDDLVILSVLQFSDVHVDSLPAEVQRADAWYDFFQVRQYTCGRVLGRTAGWRCRHTRIPSCTPSLTHAHPNAGRCGTLSQRLLAGWAFVLAFRREVFASLDASYIAATTLPPSRRCWVNGALLDGPVLVTGRAPSVANEFASGTLQKNLYATDASPSGAGGCVAPVTWAWLALCDLADEKGEHVRLDWKGEEPPSNMQACSEVRLEHDVFVPFFLLGKHIKVLELESLVSLLRRVTREGIQARRLLVLVDSSVVLGAVSKGRSGWRRVNFLLRKQRFWCLAYDIALEIVWVPTWANPEDAPQQNKPIESWYASLPKLPPPPTAVFASAHREPLSATAHMAGERVRKLESSGAFNVSEMKPAFTHDGERNSTPSIVRQLPRERLKKRMGRETADRAADCSHTSCWPCHDLISITPNVQCAAWTRSAYGIATRLLAKRIVVSYPPLRNTMTWPFRIL